LQPEIEQVDLLAPKLGFIIYYKEDKIKEVMKCEKFEPVLMNREEQMAIEGYSPITDDEEQKRVPFS
jgi:hypothetical protein